MNPDSIKDSNEYLQHIITKDRQTQSEKNILLQASMLNIKPSNPRHVRVDIHEDVMDRVFSEIQEVFDRR